MKIIFTREKDNKTFTMGDISGSFVVNSSTNIPSADTVDATGYEYSGSHGGYATAARYQRRTFDLDFYIQEKPGVSDGIIKLASQGRSFFSLCDSDLNALLYTADFYTNDKNQSEFRMQHGAISVPFSASFVDREHYATGSVSFIFGDPLLYYIGDGGASVGGIIDFTLWPTGASATTRIGRRWSTEGAVWQTAGAEWDAPASGAGGGNQTSINFVTETTVNAAITITGQISNPQIVNTTNGSEFSYVGNIADGQVLTVDTAGNVLLDGATATGTWSGTLTAQDGLNSFVLQSATSTTAARAEILLRGSF